MYPKKHYENKILKVIGAYYWGAMSGQRVLTVETRRVVISQDVNSIRLLYMAKKWELLRRLM
jgi:hypothetical protein